MRPTAMTTTRGLIVATAVAAVALSAEGFVVVLASLALLRAARRPRPVHPATAVVLTLVASGWLWANLRPTGWREVWGGMETPEGLDPVTRALFWRGWPLSPFMICIDGLKVRNANGAFLALVFDGAIFLVALFAAKVACERALRGRRARSALTRSA